MTWLRRILKVVHGFEDLLVALLLIVMIGLAVTQIVLRNGFDSGLVWADSLLRVLVLWIALIGAIVASRERQHISMDLVTRYLSPPALKAVTVITSLFTAAICAVLAWYTLDYVLMEYESPSMAFGKVPAWLCEAVMPFAFLLIAVRYLLHAVMMALGKAKARESAL